MARYRVKITLTGPAQIPPDEPFENEKTLELILKDHHDLQSLQQIIWNRIHLTYLDRKSIIYGVRIDSITEQIYPS